MKPGRVRPGDRAAPSIPRRMARWIALLVPELSDIRRHRPVLPPLVLVAVLSSAAAYALQPMLAEALDGDVVGAVRAWLWITVLLAPLSAGGKALALSAVAWSLLVISGRDAGFRRLVSIFLYGEALLALHPVALALVLQLRGSAVVASPEDLYVPMGLDALVRPDSPALAAALQGAGVVHAVWFAFLVVALIRVAELPRRWSLGLAAGAWGTVVGLGAVRALAVGGFG